MGDPLAALVPTGALAVFAGAIALGLIHGAEPGHGWPIAATYALDRSSKWVHGFAASFLLGIGHLVSSLAVVAAFFLAKSAFDLARIDEPLVVAGLPIGGPVSVVAGVLLIALGVREYRHGHSSGHGHDHADHDHDADIHSTHDHAPGKGHTHDHGNHHTNDDHGDGGWIARVVAALPFLGGHSHDHPTADDLDTKGLLGIVWTAFVLGFVHEEEFEIIALCMGSDYCLELMLAYAVAVLVALVGLTMVLIAGYYRYEERVERFAAHFPTISAVVLVAMGAGFVLGVV